MTIQTSVHREDIALALEEVGLPGCLLEFVNSVSEWAKSVRVEESNPNRLARALLADGSPFIVFKSVITEDDRSGVIGGMMLRGFDEELSRIETPEAFLEHLALHEAAHLLLPNGASEYECDQWAFEHMASRFSRRTA